MTRMSARRGRSSPRRKYSFCSSRRSILAWTAGDLGRAPLQRRERGRAADQAGRIRGGADAPLQPLHLLAQALGELLVVLDGEQDPDDAGRLDRQLAGQGARALGEPADVALDVD